MKRLFLFVLGVLITSLPVQSATPKVRPADWAQPVLGTTLGNFYQVSPDLYRSEQPETHDLPDLKALGIRSLVNLRQGHRDSAVFAQAGLRLAQHEMKAGSVSIPGLVAALREIRAAPKPALVHCWHGSDRTGFVVAGYRVVFQNWTIEQAVDELQFGGFGYHTPFYANILKTLRGMDVPETRKAVLE